MKTVPATPHLVTKTLLPVLGMAVIAVLCAPPSVLAQRYTGTNSTGLWNTSRWSANTNGPFTDAWSGSANSFFLPNQTYTFTGANASGVVNVGNITLSNNATVTFTGASGTLGGGGLVRTINVSTGALLDFGTQAFGTAAGNGWIKTGSGVLALQGGAFTNGFTLDGGVVVLRGVDAMGAGAGNILTLSNGTVAANASRAMSTAKYGGGIRIYGNITFGAFTNVTTLANETANLTFSNDVDLGGANRTLTLGNRGAMTFGGIISNGSLTFAAVSGAQVTVSGAGRFQITNTANTFTGDININGPEVRFGSDGSLGNASNNIIIDGGRLGMMDSTTNEISATRGIFVGDAAGTSISAVGAAGLLTYNGVIQNKTGETGSWIKQGGGTLVLGGASTYSGTTRIAQGVLLLTNGNNRLPAGTVLSLGQANSGNLGTLNLNGYNQEVAGLSSTTGNNATTNNNTVTSATAATLTINVTNGQSYSFGDGSDTNSGVITGSVALTKKGAGTQVLGDNNDYTGATTVEGGTLALAGTSTNQAARSTASVEVQTGATLLLSTSDQVNNAATVTLSGGTILRDSGVSEVFGNLTVSSASTLDFGAGTEGTLSFGTYSPSVKLTLNNFFGGNVLTFGSDLTSSIAVGTYNTTSYTSGDGLFEINSISGGFTTSYDGGTFTITAIPEPSTVLAALGLGGLMLWPTVRRLRGRHRRV